VGEGGGVKIGQFIRVCVHKRDRHLHDFFNLTCALGLTEEGARDLGKKWEKCEDSVFGSEDLLNSSPFCKLRKRGKETLFRWKRENTMTVLIKLLPV